MLPPRLHAALNSAGQLIDWPTCLASGVTDGELRALIRRGELVRVRRGVYTSGSHRAAVGDGPAWEVLRARAAGMGIAGRFVFSHDSAAHALGMPFLAPRHPFVHVTRPHTVVGSRHETGVKHHGAVYAHHQVVTVQGMRVLDAARTAVDLARQHGLRTGLTACDAALRQRVTRAQLRAAVEPMASWRGVRAAREAMELADAGAENPAESLARLAVIETGLGVPCTQFPVRLGQRVAWVDLLLGSHVIEFDGMVKYRRVGDGGVADRDPGQVVHDERRRERALLREGLGVSRLIWSDLAPTVWHATVARLAAEIGETVAARGAHTPPHLLEFADSMGSQRLRRLAA